MPSMLELTDEQRASVDLVSVAHTSSIGNVLFIVKLLGYSGGRDGDLVFEDSVEYRIETPGDEVTIPALLEFAEASFRDGGIPLRNPVWRDEFSGFEHHAEVTRPAIEQ